MGKIKLETLTIQVVSYCGIPQSLTQGHWMNDNQPDSYVKYKVSSKESQKGFDDDFRIDDWLIGQHPELSDKEILIHIDY